MSINPATPPNTAENHCVMDALHGILNLSEIHGLQACMEQCEFIDRARMFLHCNKEYESCFNICNDVILNIAHHYISDAGLSNHSLCCHAMMVAQTFISSTEPGSHMKCSSLPSFDLFWGYVGIACYATSLSFSDVKAIDVEELMNISRIPSALYIKREYKRIQLHILASLQWKLYFPTGG